MVQKQEDSVTMLQNETKGRKIILLIDGEITLTMRGAAVFIDRR